MGQVRLHTDIKCRAVLKAGTDHLRGVVVRGGSGGGGGNCTSNLALWDCSAYLYRQVCISIATKS